MSKPLTYQELKALREKVETLVVNDDGLGIHKIARAVYRDEDLFDLEMRYIFEGGWIYFTHESQLPNANDYFTGKVGRQPVVISRGKDDEIRGFLNVCSHRGAQLYRRRRGNAKIQMCGFHGWCFNNKGELVDVKDQRLGEYPANFDKKDLGLTPVRVESYRGFIFVSLKWDVQSLADYLGSTTKLIDLVVDQSPVGRSELLPGVSRYTYDANWKVGLEGGVDGYHAFPVHESYVETMMLRASGASANSTPAMDLSAVAELDGGCMSFPNGHSLLSNHYANFTTRPHYVTAQHLQASHGSDYYKWVVERSRNLQLFPNLILMDAISAQVRVITPISVNKTMVEAYCIAPVGEDAATRTMRIRQYEDFYNATGTATPDDNAEFLYSQVGFEARGARYTDLSRGRGRYIKGASPFAKQIGLNPSRCSDSDVGAEVHYMDLYDEWSRRILEGIANEREYAQ